ncbi:MAG: GNAT family N-acetyltransferase [Syntrophothermus sp.]
METDFRSRGFSISTDNTKFDFSVIHEFLSNSYWARGIPEELIRKSVENSLTFGLFFQDKQIGLARVITDFTTFAYVADVFVLEAYRRLGLSKWLMQTILSYPDLQKLRRWLLATRDAHGLYSQFGFKPVKNPERFMEIHDPDFFKKETL